MDATQKIHKLYNDYYYDFIPDDSIPVGYEFNSEVLDYVISQGGNFLNAWITQRYGKIINWVANSVYQGVFSIFRTLAVANNFIVANIFDQDAFIYQWTYECTGIEETNTEYGTKYGFLFTGMVGETFSIVLNQNGNIWGSEPIGNITFNSDSEEIINQIAPSFDPNEINVPITSYRSFENLKPPYIDGKSMHMFFYVNDVEHEIIVEDFTRTITTFWYEWDKFMSIMFFKVGGGSISVKYDGSTVVLEDVTISYNGIHGSTWTIGKSFYLNSGNGFDKGLISFNYPCYTTTYASNRFTVGSPNRLGFVHGVAYNGSGDIWLDSISTTPTGTPANPNPVPISTPIPITEIPETPTEPIPQTPTPDPVPGIPVNPVPIPLPPFASLVSGNDELWGETLGFEEAQDGLLPYMTSLSEFSFPSFTDLISDFSGSIIWVAQIMSILYNGTSFNVLFIALCLFSLVSILIGAYKLWATTEPDPNNPGFRRSKRPPKPPKRRRRR